MPVKGQRGARKRAWELFVEHGLSVAMVAKRLRVEGYALSNAGHPTRTQVEQALRSEYRRLIRAKSQVPPKYITNEVPW